MTLYAKDAGVWKPSYEPSAKDASVWKPIKEYYGKDAGVWKPTLIDPYYASVSLLIHGDGADGSTTITDTSPSPKTVVANDNTQIDTAQSVFAGGSSIYLDGTGDYLSVAANAGFTFTGDFTLEFFVRFNTAPASDRNVCHTNVNNGISLYQTGTLGSWQVARGGVASELAFSWSPVVGTWYHFAVSRASGTMRVFVNGTQIASGASSYSFLQNGFWFGRDYISTARYINCWVEELRVTNGVGRYTANFTVPVLPFRDR